jgi:hypothetical protein
MTARVVRLGAWCDLETEDDARARLLADTGPEVSDERTEEGAEPRPGRFVPAPGEPVLSPGSLAFRVEEFADLADGTRLRLHAERGFGLSAGGDPWRLLTLAGLEADVRTTVLPDDAEETGEDHPWDWLAQLLRASGVDAAPDELRTLPYVVEFSDRLRARVPAGS